MFGLSRRAKGAISVFLAIIYIFVFVLLAVLVDGGRIRMAEAQAEQIQQLANESMLTYYHRALYEYYDLFGETQYAADEMGSMISEMMQQAMTAKPGTTLQSAMGASWMFSTDGKSYFDPYDLKVDSITAGSNLNLANDNVFRSQINDAMKYTGPVIIANNFLDILSGFQNAQEGVQAVSECTDAVSDVAGQITAYGKTLEELRNELYNFSDNPDGALSKAARDNSFAFHLIEYAKQFDTSAEEALQEIKNKQEEAENQNTENASDGAEEAGPTAEDYAAADAALNAAYDKYMDKMNAVHANAVQLYQELDAAIDAGAGLVSNIRAQQSALRNQAGGKASDVAGIYNDFADQLDVSAEKIEEYYHVLMTLKGCAERMINSSPTADAFHTAAAGVLNRLKAEHDASAASMAGDSVASSYSQALLSQQNSIIQTLNENLMTFDDGEEELAQAESKVKEAVESADTDSSNVADTDRLGTVPSSTEEDESIKDFSKDHYDRDNASGKANEVSTTIANLNSTFLGDLTGSLRDDLFESAYILSFFRDYVHTCKMDKDNVGKDGYDTVANDKFLEGDSYLTAEQYRSIETTCAEAEYILFGNPSTKSDVTAAYASVYGIRLAFDYVSVFLQKDSRKVVLDAAKSAGMYAPLVLVLMPFAYAVPQAAIEMNMIMKGKCAPLFLTGSDPWFAADYSDKKLLAGYSDYLLMLLVMMNQQNKVDRMQDIIQMNMQKLDSEFTLQKALVNVYVQSECSVRYVFMTQAFMPAQYKMDGRYQFSLATSVSY